MQLNLVLLLFSRFSGRCSGSPPAAAPAPSPSEPWSTRGGTYGTRSAHDNEPIPMYYSKCYTHWCTGTQQDEGSLSYVVREDTRMERPTDVRPCCACNEAKYEVVFEGLWSRHLHPKDFPADEWRTQFSQLIGASHSKNYAWVRRTVFVVLVVLVVAAVVR